MTHTRPAGLLHGAHIGRTIRHPKAGKAFFERLDNGHVRVTHSGWAKITMITHKKNGEVVVRTDVDQQNVSFIPGEIVHLEENDG